MDFTPDYSIHTHDIRRIHPFKRLIKPIAKPTIKWQLNDRKRVSLQIQRLPAVICNHDPYSRIIFLQILIQTLCHFLTFKRLEDNSYIFTHKLYLITYCTNPALYLLLQSHNKCLLYFASLILHPSSLYYSFS